jgi:glycosyltransferase
MPSAVTASSRRTAIAVLAKDHNALISETKHGLETAVIHDHHLERHLLSKRRRDRAAHLQLPSKRRNNDTEFRFRHPLPLMANANACYEPRMAASPTVSIITPLLNRATLLPAALESVSAQTLRPLEHIVVDGGSSDGSQGIARQAGAIVIDAPGSSIYEAINMGMAAARGEVLCLLNSDDWFARDALQHATAALLASPEIDLVRGRATQGDKYPREDALSAGASISLESVLFGPCNINACCFRRRLVERIGAFDVSYRIAADREWLARVVTSGVQTTELRRLLYHYRAHEDSLTIGANKPAERLWVEEHFRMAEHALRGRALTTDERRTYRMFAAKETAHLAWLKQRTGTIGDMATAITDGFKRDPLWPAFALGPLAQTMLRRLRAGSGSAR